MYSKYWVFCAHDTCECRVIAPREPPRAKESSFLPRVFKKSQSTSGARLGDREVFSWIQGIPRDPKGFLLDQHRQQRSIHFVGK